MIVDRSYQAVTGRMAQIIEKAMGVDYSRYEREGIVFDYEALMNDTGYSLEDCPEENMEALLEAVDRYGKY